MISIKQKGDFSKSISFLKKSQHPIDINLLRKYGEEGVKALSSATPVDTGLTARSWKYEIKQTPKSVTLNFYNTNIQNGVPIAIIIQYGHATGNGAWVEGRDYINPVTRPLFDKIAVEAWAEVVKT